MNIAIAPKSDQRRQQILAFLRAAVLTRAAIMLIQTTGYKQVQQ